MKRLISLAILSLIFLSSASQAIDVIEFEDEIQRDRFQQLAFELRCPKCQNQNLVDSDSQISQDLRQEIARLILDGYSDQEIKREMVALYGDFILYKPPVQPNTMVLWVGPVVMVLIGLFIFAVIVVKRSRVQSVELPEQEIDRAGYETDIDADMEEVKSSSVAGDNGSEKNDGDEHSDKSAGVIEAPEVVDSPEDSAAENEAPKDGDNSEKKA